ERVAHALLGDLGVADRPAPRRDQQGQEAKGVGVAQEAAPAPPLHPEAVAIDEGPGLAGGRDFHGKYSLVPLQDYLYLSLVGTDPTVTGFCSTLALSATPEIHPQPVAPPITVPSKIGTTSRSLDAKRRGAHGPCRRVGTCLLPTQNLYSDRL